MATQKIKFGQDNILSRTTPGVTDWFLLNTNRDTTKTTIGVYVSDDFSGVNATVQYCLLDDPDSAPISAIRDHNIKNVTSYDDGNLEYSVSAVRLNVSAITTGEVFLIVRQNGSQ